MYYVKLDFFFSIAVGFLLNQIIVDAIDIINGDYQDSASENLRYARQSDQRCQIPSNPLHTKYKLIGETAYNYGPGDYAQNYNVLEISCESEYKINPIFQNHSICINGKWNPPLPNCLRACPSLMSVISTRVNCKWNDPDGNDIPLHNCLNPVEGTTVYLSCNPFYEEASILKNPVRVCREGRWDPSIPLCYPICGLKRPKAMLNIINGSNTMPGDYPWQVGIYNTQKDLICGGSILDYRVIVSAAHCFTDHDGNVNPKENYAVAAGKYYRKYDDDRDKYSQYSSIFKIHVPSRYKGVINQQGYDIAILILEDPFRISLHVQPVCIELNEESPDLHLSLNKNGIVTGWGYTQSGKELAEKLQEVIIPYVPFGECFKTVPKDFRRYITHDSICGGYVNLSTSVCAGDSGGGLIFQKLNADRHYIKGIVSVSPATDEGVCNSNQISVFTSIAKHTDFVRKHLAFNQIRQNIECTQDECLNNKPVNTSVEICNGNSRFDCKNFKKHCTLPHFPPNGKFILNRNESYEPGAAVESNSILSLKCDIGYVNFENAGCENSSYCSDTGEWIPTQTNEKCSTCTNVICGYDGHLPKVWCKNQSCHTPDGLSGFCKPLANCTPLYTIIKNETLVKIVTREYLRGLRCPDTNQHSSYRTPTQYSICCPSNEDEFERRLFPKNLLPDPDKNECGIDIQNKIKFGMETSLTESPWTVLLHFESTISNNDVVCAGSLISERYVVTAAHCVEDPAVRKFGKLNRVTLGEYNITSETDCIGKTCADPVVVAYVEEVILHPDWYTQARQLINNDIALIRLTDPVQFTLYVKPVCLPQANSNIPDNIPLEITGWRRLKEKDATSASDVKLKAKADSYNKNICRNYYKYNEDLNIGDGIFCAVGTDGMDSCNGDSGGPIMQRGSNANRMQITYLAGLVSFGPKRCGEDGAPALYTQMSRYIDWIKNNIRP